MSAAADRDATVAALTRNGIPLEAIRQIMRHAQTIQRVAIMECNGKVPTRATVSSDRCCAAIKALGEKHGFVPMFNGDPRGYVVKLKLADGSYNTWGGPESGWGIPARG